MQTDGFVDRMRLVIDALRGRLPEATSSTESSNEVITASSETGDDTQLVLALIACLDFLEEDEEVVERARMALAREGIEPLGSIGERFDRARHRAQGRLPTHDPTLDWTIASCASLGWARDGAVLRPADVWVYRLSEEGRKEEL